MGLKTVFFQLFFWVIFLKKEVEYGERSQFDFNQISLGNWG
jgi:hypothetical protein